MDETPDDQSTTSTHTIETRSLTLDDKIHQDSKAGASLGILERERTDSELALPLKKGITDYFGPAITQKRPHRFLHTQSRPSTTSNPTSDDNKPTSAQGARPTKKAKQEKHGLGPTGSSRSATAEKEAQEAANRGEFEVNEKKLDNWKAKILLLDKDAEFYKSNIQIVCHSSCGLRIKMKEPYNATRFRSHVDGCKGDKKPSNKSGGTRTLTQMASMYNWSDQIDKSDVRMSQIEDLKEPLPCPGLTEVDDERIPIYLWRTCAAGGGAQSLVTISELKYDKLFSSLGKKERKIVLDTQVHGWKWRNDHASLRIFSVQCDKVSTERRENQCPLPCSQCLALLSLRSFTNLLNKPVPEEENYIYVNNRFRNPVLGESYAKVKGLKQIFDNAVRLRPCRVIDANAGFIGC